MNEELLETTEKVEEIVFKEDSIIINRPVEETPLDIIHRLCTEIYGKEYYDVSKLINEERQRIGAQSNREYQIALRFENYDISNGRQNHRIHGLYIIFYLNSDFKLIGSLHGFRHKVTREEIISDYAHSHFPTLSPNYNLNNAFCLGDSDTEIFQAFYNYREQTFNEVNFRRLLITLIGYSSWESQSGGPYRFITNISAARNNDNVIDISEERLQKCLISSDNPIMMNNLVHISRFQWLNKFINRFITNNLSRLNYVPSIIDGKVIYKNNLNISDIDDYLFSIIKTMSVRDFVSILNLNIGSESCAIKIGNTYYTYSDQNTEGLRRIRSFRENRSNYITLSTGHLKAEIINDIDDNNTSEGACITFHPYLSKMILEYIKSMYIQFKLETNEFGE